MKLSILIIVSLMLQLTVSAFGQKPERAKLQDKVVLKLNDKVTVTFRAHGDKLDDPKIASQMDGKPFSVSFSFTSEKGVRILAIRNEFSRGIRMRCLIRVAGAKEFVENSVHPLFPNFFSNEAFGEPVEEIVLFDFKLTDDKLPQ